MEKISTCEVSWAGGRESHIRPAALSLWGSGHGSAWHREGGAGLCPAQVLQKVGQGRLSQLMTENVVKGSHSSEIPLPPAPKHF